MDVGKKIHQSRLEGMNLLFGAVIYAAGRLGREPVRSQGHIHRKARGNRLSPPEIYEIWNGKAIVYMQESAGDSPGRCFAVEADPGEIVIVPPDWAHATISADIDEPLVFGAWCDRNYGFEYEQVRSHHGLAWFPILNEDKISWLANENYFPARLINKKPGDYHFLGLRKGIPIYTQFEENREKLSFVANPDSKSGHWENFTP
jgi:glucose-6-phosphate isomerase